VHTIGSFGLLGLGHSFHVPQPKVDRMRTEKTGTLVFTNMAARRETSTVWVRTGLLRGPSHSDGLQRKMP